VNANPNIPAARSPVSGATAGAAKSTAPAAPATLSVRVLRVPGEAFDADQITPNCSECGLNEYACECDDPWGYGPVKSREEIEANYRAALDRIARVFLGVGA
jgi:hypothetical protein